MCGLRSFLFFLMIPVCASAQPAPTVVTTLVSTNTGATSICAGGAPINTPSTCTGGLKAGVTLLNGVADNTGLSVTATTTSRPAISFMNASTGLLSFIQGTNDKGLIFYGNGSSAQAIKIHASSGVSVGDAVDPGDNNLGVLGAVSAGGALAAGSTLTVSGAAALNGAATVAGALGVGGVATTFAVTAPTINTCGTGSTVAGKAFAFKVTIGTGVPTLCQLLFNTTFTTAPICNANDGSGTAPIGITTTTTSMSALRDPGWDPAEVVFITCFGY